MAILAMRQQLIIVPVLLISMVTISSNPLRAGQDVPCNEKAGSCSQKNPLDRTEGTYKWGKLDFSPNQKPNAFWASQPTGKFTKQEIFDICAQTALLGYNGLNARIKGEPKSKHLDQISTMMAGGYEKSNHALREREPLLYEKARKLFAVIGGSLYDTAYVGGERSLANLLQRDGFEQFYPKLISGCYKNLASW